MQLAEIDEFEDSASESQNAPSRDLINEALGLLNSQEGSAVLKQSTSVSAAVDELLRQSVPRELHLCISGMPEDRPTTEMNLCVSPLQNRQSPKELSLCAARLKERQIPTELIAPILQEARSDSDVRRSYYQQQYDLRRKPKPSGKN